MKPGARTGWAPRLAPGLAPGLAALMLATAGTASAGKADATQAMAERAAAHVRAVGRDQAFADFTRPDGGFVQDGIYVFCFSPDGPLLAHGGNPQLVGKVFKSLRDANGNLATAEMGHVWTQDALWIDYRWPNPATRRIEAKSAYLIRIDGRTACGATYYKGDAPTGEGAP